MLAELKSRRTALVTGASYGVGAATALALGARGFDIAVTATRTENLADIGQLERRVCGSCRSRSTCARRRASSARWPTLSAFGELDLLVNNAGANFASLRSMSPRRNGTR